MHALPGVQSLSVWHGHAHFWAATLQRWVRQWASTVQGRGFGVASAGVETPAAGVAANAGRRSVTGTGGWCHRRAGAPGACAGG